MTVATSTDNRMPRFISVVCAELLRMGCVFFGVYIRKVGQRYNAGRFEAILGPVLFGILSDLNLSVPVLFIIFSLPLLISGVAVYNIPSRNLR